MEKQTSKSKKPSAKEIQFKTDAMWLRDIDFVSLKMAIEVDGKRGVIVGINRSANFDVVFDGSKIKSNCHPFWKTKYFDETGKLIKEY